MRKYIFFLIDLIINQGKIKGNLNEISYHIEKKQVVYEREKLKEILIYVINNVPYYSGVEKADLLKFPIVNKYLLRQRIDEFISRTHKKEDLIKVVTSGSTGLPFESYQDKEKRYRNTADTIFFASKAGYSLGNTLAYLKVWNEVNKKSILTRLAENIIPINVFSLSSLTIKKLIKKLNNYRNVNFLGYASALEEIAQHILKSNLVLNFQTNSIITMSEGLSPLSRKLIMKAFDCKCIYARYSNIENGIIAQQINSMNYYLINTASYIVEILDDFGNKLEYGKLGRIVITDLYNKGMPFIRYDTGDIGCIELVKDENDIERLVLSQIEGRRMDVIYNSNGELTSPFTITNGMWKYSEILQYQFIQTNEKEYLFKLNIDKPFKRECELLADFKRYLGDDADFSVEYVKEIPLLASGKRRKVVNEWKNLS